MTSVEGLAVLSMTEKSKIGLKTVSWNPDKFEFAASLSCVTKEDIENRLGGIIEQQWRSVCSGGPVGNDDILSLDLLTLDDARAYLSMEHYKLTQNEYFTSVYICYFLSRHNSVQISSDLGVISSSYSQTRC